MKSIIKRLFDLTIAVLSLLLLFAPMILVMIILKFTGEGEIFYLQKRLGYLNNEFKIIKFATMVKNSPNIGTGSLTLRGDPRVLPFGNFLRKSKINELPQIFNVIIGNMSIVGPRPQMKVDFDKFPPKKRNEIYKSKPGITGIGSIIFRDEENIFRFEKDPIYFDNNFVMPYKDRLELWYIDNLSIGMYFKVITATIIVVLFPSLKAQKYLFQDIPEPPIELRKYLIV
jgi:lipopolysaccharide/colanic/teichoic acid biosynthesis glycosyltransferase